MWETFGATEEELEWHEAIGGGRHLDGYIVVWEHVLKMAWLMGYSFELNANNVCEVSSDMIGVAS